MQDAPGSQTQARDKTAIRDAGVDTHRVVRNVMIAFLESATLHGIFHGDFHGGNLFVQPDGKVALLEQQGELDRLLSGT